MITRMTSRLKNQTQTGIQTLTRPRIHQLHRHRSHKRHIPHNPTLTTPRTITRHARHLSPIPRRRRHRARHRPTRPRHPPAPQRIRRPNHRRRNRSTRTRRRPELEHLPRQPRLKSRRRLPPSPHRTRSRHQQPRRRLLHALALALSLERIRHARNRIKPEPLIRARMTSPLQNDVRSSIQTFTRPRIHQLNRHRRRRDSCNCTIPTRIMGSQMYIPIPQPGHPINRVASCGVSAGVNIDPIVIAIASAYSYLVLIFVDRIITWVIPAQRNRTPTP